MHFCDCCRKEFHTKFLLNKHVVTSVVCQNHFTTEALKKEIVDLRAELTLKTHMVLDLVKANVALTQQFIGLSQVQTQPLGPETTNNPQDNTGDIRMQLDSTCVPRDSIMHLINSTDLPLASPSTLPSQEGFTSSSREDNVMSLLKIT